MDVDIKPSVGDLVPCECHSKPPCLAGIIVNDLITMVEIVTRTTEGGTGNTILLTPESADDLALVLQEVAADVRAGVKVRGPGDRAAGSRD